MYGLIIAIVILLGLYMLLRPEPVRPADIITLQQLSDSARIEQPYASTPINKVDDYEFSRVFGVERNGRMEVPHQTFNMLLTQRTFDWAERPLSSDERREKYMGLREGFTAAGDLKSYAMGPELVKDALQQFRGEEKEVEGLIQEIYKGDAEYEPVVTKIGANHWEVNELRPRRTVAPQELPQELPIEAPVAIKPLIKPTYNHNPVDPYFVATGNLPYESDRHADPWYGPVPGMERMFGPTFDQAKWT